MDSHPYREGIVYSLGAMFLFCMSDALIKHYLVHYDPFQLMGLTYVGAALLGFVYALFKGVDLLQVNRPLCVLTYGVLYLLEMCTFFYALASMNFSIVFVFVMVIPIVASKMANVFLKEPLSLRQHIALLLAFLGVLATVLLPHDGASLLQATALGVLFSVLNIFLCATKMVFLKKYGALENPPVLNFWALAVMAVGGVTIALLRGTAAFPGLDMAWLGVYPILTFVGGLIYVLSYKYAPATIVAPMLYSQLIWAMLLGALFFHEPFTAPLLIGAACVVAAGALFYWPVRAVTASSESPR